MNDENERLQVTSEWTTSFAENVFPGWSSGQVASNDGEESIDNGSSRVSTLPTAAGILWGRRDILEDIPAYMGGGEMIADVFLDHRTRNWRVCWVWTCHRVSESYRYGRHTSALICMTISRHSRK